MRTESVLDNGKVSRRGNARKSNWGLRWVRSLRLRPKPDENRSACERVDGIIRGSCTPKALISMAEACELHQQI